MERKQQQQQQQQENSVQTEKKSKKNVTKINLADLGSVKFTLDEVIAEVKINIYIYNAQANSQTEKQSKLALKK